MLGPAGVDADAAGRGLPAHRRAARGRDRHRPRADGHPDAARARAWSASSSSSTAPAWPTCRWPTARRSATCRPSTAPPAASSRSTPRRSATSSSPAARRSGSSWSRPTCSEQGLFHERELRGGRPTPTRSSSTCRRSCRASPGRGARRTACRCATPARRSARSSRELGETATARAARLRRGGRGELPGQRPADRQTGVGEADADPAPSRRHRGGHEPAAPVTLDGESSSSPRRGGDRGDHQLHQHLEPVGDGGRRAAGQEGGRARAARASRGSRPASRPARRS